MSEDEEQRWLDDEAGPIIRPYTITRGRTRAGDGPELDLMAQVVIGPRATASLPQLAAEQRAIIERCRRPLSIAELSAYLDLPVGVVRVLVGDLLAAGLVVVHHQRPSRALPDISILEKVIHGLRAI